jgi:hypothetical protein
MTVSLDSEVIAQLEAIFYQFLQRVCSDRSMTDSSGASIHQTATDKRIQALEQQHKFLPFRLRIHSFSNLFQDCVRQAGYDEGRVSARQLKQFLWTQRYINIYIMISSFTIRYIKRFTEDGKKLKSHGHHVWMVEARRDVSNGFWIFREYERCISNEPPPAYVGSPWTYAPKVWDPQVFGKIFIQRYCSLMFFV